MSPLFRTLLLGSLLCACRGDGTDTASGYGFTDREPGERAPPTATCDDQDPVRCLLPWPSDTFAVADDTTATGIRLAVEAEALPVDDDPAFLNRADGFSRITGFATAFEAELDPDSLAGEGAAQLLVAEPGHEDYGTAWPVELEVVEGGSSDPEQMVVGRPLLPLPANAEHVVVITDTLTAADGSALPVEHHTEVALGLVDPASEPEAALAAWFAPTRTLLQDLGIAPETVLRVWSFTTRSATDPTKRLQALYETVDEALAAGTIEAAIDELEEPGGEIALIAGGYLEGVPYFLDDSGNLSLDENDLPEQQGTHEARFRVVVPAGTGDYRVALYGHGTGGNIDDDSFDEALAGEGIAKVNLEWRGWTDDTLLTTLAGLTAFVSGSAESTAGLMQSLADGHAILGALSGSLGEELSSSRFRLLDSENPAQGRWPDTTTPVWVGGSQGGTMGAVVTASTPEIAHGVLNVPGAGWTHFIPGSYTYEAYLEALMLPIYEDVLDLQLAILASQGAWDDIDGASWGDVALEDGDMFLLQESMGDPILPNIGTEILAGTLEALLLEPCLEPVDTLDTTPDPVTAGAALEQFAVPDEGVYAVHGFAARDTPAGDAALEQILEFLESVWAGDPTISHPDGCTESTADGSCDFEEAW